MQNPRFDTTLGSQIGADAAAALRSLVADARDDASTIDSVTPRVAPDGQPERRRQKGKTRGRPGGVGAVKTAVQVRQPEQQQPKRHRPRRRALVDIQVPVVVVSRPASQAKPAHLALQPAKQLKNRRFAGEDWFEQRKHEE